MVKQENSGIERVDKETCPKKEFTVGRKQFLEEIRQQINQKANLVLKLKINKELNHRRSEMLDDVMLIIGKLAILSKSSQEVAEFELIDFLKDRAWNLYERI